MNTIDLLWYTSVTGIVVVTVFLIELVKRLLGNLPYSGRLPTWLYVVVVAAVLTEACHLAGVLAGTTVSLLMQAVVLGAVSSGFKEWWSNAGKPLSATAAARTQRGELP